jgi:uncharacterized protein (UPF0332 family)
MKDERILAIREKVLETFAIAEDSFESAVLLYESEKYRTSIPLFADSILGGIKALLMLYLDKLPPEDQLLDSYHKSEIYKEMKSEVKLDEVLKKLKNAAKDSLQHPLKFSEESTKNLDWCYKNIENFLARAHKFIKKSLLTTQEIKKRKFVKRLIITISAAVAAILLLAAIFQHILSLGRGLSGKYFADQNFEKLIETRKDKRIDFDWGLGEVIHNFADHVSIRWTGKIKIPKSGTYKFIIRSDDGARLWIDDNLVIDDWNIHAAEDRGAKINLESRLHNIRVEYFEEEGFASMKLLWIKPGEQKKEIIPSSYLRRRE